MRKSIIIVSLLLTGISISSCGSSSSCATSEKHVPKHLYTVDQLESSEEIVAIANI